MVKLDYHLIYTNRPCTSIRHFSQAIPADVNLGSGILILLEPQHFSGFIHRLQEWMLLNIGGNLMRWLLSKRQSTPTRHSIELTPTIFFGLRRFFHFPAAHGVGPRRCLPLQLSVRVFIDRSHSL